VVVEIAAVGGHGAGGESAGSGADFDRLGESGGGVSAEFGGLDQPSAVVGQQSSEQHFVSAVRIERLGYQFTYDSAWYQAGSIGEFAGGVAQTEQAGQWHHDTDPNLP
jgi:hypothetical protein